MLAGNRPNLSGEEISAILSLPPIHASPIPFRFIRFNRPIFNYVERPNPLENKARKIPRVKGALSKLG